MACLYHYIWVYLIGINNAISIVFTRKSCVITFCVVLVKVPQYVKIGDFQSVIHFQ